MQSPPPVSTYTCAGCGRRVGVDEQSARHDGETTPAGWSCGACGRAYRAMIDWIAGSLLANHEDWWLPIRTHPRGHCMFCDVILRAQDLTLTAPEPDSWRAAQARNVANFQAALREAGRLERLRLDETQQRRANRR